MDQKYFRIPFALTGDVATVPDPVQGTGEVSFEQGYGADYQRDQSSDPLAKPIERNKFNWMLNKITEAVKQYQEFGIPEWIKPADNNTVAKAYSKGTIVRYSATTPGVTFELYQSLIDTNTTTPGANPAHWQLYTYAVASQAQVDAGTETRALVNPATLESKLTTRANESAAVPGGYGVACSHTTVDKLLTFTADVWVIANSQVGRAYKRTGTLNFNGATTGVNGMNAGATPANGFVAIYAIFNPTTSTLASYGITESGSPAAKTLSAGLPAGYTAGVLISVWKTDAGGNFVVGSQREKRLDLAPVLVVSGSFSANVAATTITVTTVIPRAARILHSSAGLQSDTAGPVATLATAAYALAGVLFSTGNRLSVRGVSLSQGDVSEVQLSSTQTPQTFVWQMGYSGSGAVSVEIYVHGYEIY